jgi:DNA repair photolyase
MTQTLELQRQFKLTSAGKPMDWYIQEQIASGQWREETIGTELTGLTRPITVLRAARATNLITYDWHGDKNTFCPPMWWDLAIGSGACNFACRSCFLILTHRIKRDPMRHLLYDNVADFEKAARAWLTDRSRRKQHTLGVGIDRSDSLLYEGVTGHVRTLAPFFGSSDWNRHGNKLILLTKSANVKWLADIAPVDRQNVVISFSLNPEEIADLWEGKWPDTGERITPAIPKRLQAARLSQHLGHEVRVRLDPILTPEGWEDYYRYFVRQVKTKGIKFTYWTLGTYREKNSQLDGWRERWGLLPMEWQPGEDEMVKEGTHRHLPEARRVEIYRTVQDIIRAEFPQAKISLCKETHSIRRAVAGMCNANCNCLV